jgi:transcription-repair coupling factor (superfamily II helicase)
LSLEKQKENYDNPNVENKVFQENRESFLDYISEKTVLFIQNSEDLFSQLDKQFDRKKKLLKNCQRTSNMPRQINYFKPKDFYKKSLRFFDSGIALNQFLESPINLNSFSHNLIQQTI